MIYDIRHVTSYSYENPVSFARCADRFAHPPFMRRHVVARQINSRIHRFKQQWPTIGSGKITVNLARIVLYFMLLSTPLPAFPQP